MISKRGVDEGQGSITVMEKCNMVLRDLAQFHTALQAVLEINKEYAKRIVELESDADARKKEIKTLRNEIADLVRDAREAYIFYKVQQASRASLGE